MRPVRSRRLAAIACAVLCLSGARPGERPAPSPPPLGAILENGNVLSGLSEIALTTESLQANPEVLEQAERQLGLLSVIVQCALAPDQTVSGRFAGQDFEFTGVAGAAQQWADGPCDEACQEMVSSCVLTKLNNWNMVARILIESSVPLPGEEPVDRVAEGFVIEEGAFYGNIFADPPRLYTCRGRGRDPFYDVVRICTHRDNNCGVAPVGPCLPRDGEGDEIPHACEAFDEERGAFRRCHNRLSLPDGSFPTDSLVYDDLFTVHLPGTAFRAGLEATGECSDAPPPGDHPPRSPATSPAAVGDPCETDDDCLSPEMTCRRLEGPGFCTLGCQDDPDPAVEEAQCGAGNTCLRHPNGNAYCVQACEPVTEGGAGCPEGRACTSFELSSGEADAPGCTNFCSADSDCAESQYCGRDGTCYQHLWAGDFEDRLPDGALCELRGDVACRGTCLLQGDTQGICASVIDLARTPACPDDPTLPLIQRPGDDLAGCAFRSCGSDAGCEPPLVCRFGQCTVP